MPMPFGRLLRVVAANDATPDIRGRRMVAVIECILNQNARDAGAACSPALNAEVVYRCCEQHIGILQIPCPECAHLGIARRRGHGVSLHEAMETPEGLACCACIAEETAARLADHVRAGQQVLAILGGNARSPGCAVILDQEGLSPLSGTLMRALHTALKARALDIPIIPIRDADARRHADDLARLDMILSSH